MFSYNNFKSKMQRNSEEKITHVAYATWYGNTFFVLILAVILLNLIGLIMSRIDANRNVYIVIYLLILLAAGVYVGTRKAGLALSANRVTYVKFKHFRFIEKEVYEIPFDKIKSLTVIKILNMRIVKMSFISNDGQFIRTKCMFSSFLLGSDSQDFNRDSAHIYQKLADLQKIIDRGDF